MPGGFVLTFFAGHVMEVKHMKRRFVSENWEGATMSKKTDIELALWRSGLLRCKIARGALESACATVARHAARLDRINQEGCNGVPKTWNEARREWDMGLDDGDTARHEKQTIESRKGIRAALAPFLTPGCVWYWKTDPRAGCVLRIADKPNRRDCFI
jgi:hypothetical protein